jgi:hypothetical protein
LFVCLLVAIVDRRRSDCVFCFCLSRIE